MTRKQLVFIAMRVICTLAVLLVLAVILRPSPWIIAVLAPIVYIFFDVYGKRLFQRALQSKVAGRVIQKTGLDQLLVKKAEAANPDDAQKTPGLTALLRSSMRYRYAIYFDAPSGSEHQVLMWLPYLSRVKANFVIVLRANTSAKLFRDMGLPVLVIPKLADLDVVENIGVKVVLYVNNGMRNTHMIRYHKLTHVQLLHGESDKPSSYNPISAMYDFLFVSGQIAIDRYYDNGIFIPGEKFKVVSRPQVEDVLVKGRDEPSVVWPVVDFLDEEDKAELRASGLDTSPPEIDLSVKTVFYATTWSGFQEDSDFSSIFVAPKLVSKLIDLGYRVIFRPHPYSLKDSEQKKIVQEIVWLMTHANRHSGLGHCVSNHADFNMMLPEITDCINASDFMISDVSSVLADWLASNKPFVTVDTGKLDEMQGVNKLSMGGHVLKANLKNLNEIMTDVSGPDSMAEVRFQNRKAALGIGIDERPEELFAKEIEHLITEFDKEAFNGALIEHERTSAT